MPGRTDRRFRMVALLLVFTLAGTAAMVRLGQWQVVAAPELVARVQQKYARVEQVWRPRGDILDRRGDVLAQTTVRDMLVAHPDLIDAEEQEGIVATLAERLDMPTEAARTAYAAKLSSDEQWAWLERQLTPEQSVSVQAAMDEGLLPGIALEPKQVRLYPRRGGQDAATLASQLLGFVDAGGRGMYGIERAYDARLSGAEVPTAALASVGAPSGTLQTTLVPPLRLTIDSKLQKQLERELIAARIENRAVSVSGIIMDPYSGAILASASVPGYDANDFAAVAGRSPSQLRDRVISSTYEPGSVMKTFTVAAALDKGVVTPTTRIRDQRVLTFGTDRIRNADKDTMGTLRVKDVIANSRNVATSKLAAMLAPSTTKAAHLLYGLWERVGIVGKTGVDLASEESGLASDPDARPWAPIDLANRSFGQGISVTLLQLATGYATIVNGGLRVQPHVVAEEAPDPQDRERVLSAKVARQVRDILVHVTGSVSHYARGSLIPGYLIGGKTGTAQIWDVARQDWKRRFNHTFVGFVGGDRPEALIAVRIEEARYSMASGYMDLKVESYELFKLIAQSAIKRLGIERSSDPEAGLPILGTPAARSLTPERSRATKATRPERSERKPKRGGAGASRQRAADGGSADASAGDPVPDGPGGPAVDVVGLTAAADPDAPAADGPAADA